ncbi:MAG: right-handed parallel beta-helix repeat-containing protein [Bacteroidia bacterium]|nr:right-handed parallel beta-helix repeat-containing protein [Bacteroidia bacterium]
MRRVLNRDFLLAFLLSCAPFFTFAALSGNYTINSGAAASATNYQSFTAAISDLNSGTRSDGGPVQGPGISASVIFTVAAGTYNEAVSLNPVTGANASKTITFDGVDPNTRKITTASNVAYASTFRLNGADYIHIKNLAIENTGVTYGYGLQFENQCNFCEVDGCKISVQSYATGSYRIPVMTGQYYTTYSDAVNYLTFNNNEIKGGYYGMVLNGPSGSGSQVNTVTNNTFSEVYYIGFYSYYQTLGTFDGNYIAMGSQSTTSAYGATIRYWNEFSFSRNTIHTVGSYGAYIYYSNQNTSNRSRIANNMIGGNYLSTSNGYGLYVYTGNNLDIWHNSVLVDVPGTAYVFYMLGTHSGHNIQNNTFSYNGTGSGYAIYMGSTTYATTMDYNNYYSTGGLYAYFGAAYANLTALQAANSSFHQNCQAVWPNHFSSTNLHVFGAAMANWANNGTTTTVDIDGDPRPFPPDITKDVGADEYVLAPFDADILAISAPVVLALGNNTVTIDLMNNGQNSLNSTSMTVQYSSNGGTTWVSETFTPTGLGSTGATQSYSFTTPLNIITPGTYTICARINPQVSGDPDPYDSTCVSICTGMSGTYTIDNGLPTSGTNYNSFTDAAAALNSCGINGPVLFNVAPGTYTEAFSISSIPGSSATNTVTFDGLDVDSVSVEYNYSTTNFAIIELNGADYVTFRNIQVKATGNYGYCFKLTNQADHNTIEDCRILASSLVLSVYNSAIVSCGQFYSTNGDNANYLTIRNNEIMGGYYTISLRGISTTTFNDSILVEGNNISMVGYAGIYGINLSNLVVRNNEITGDPSGSTTGSAMYFNYLEENFLIENNVAHSTGMRALYCSYCNEQNLGTQNIIRNNMFGGGYIYTSTCYSVYMYNAANVDFFYNSVNLGNSNGYGLYWGGSLSLGNEIKNNIFNSEGPSSYAMYLATWNTVSSINYNVYNSLGTALVYISTTPYTTIGAYQTAYPTFDQQSVQAKPGFVSDIDLHIFCSTIDNLGSPIAGITQDLDGDTRSLTTPDIGADEFTGVIVSVDLGPDTSVCGDYYMELDTLVWSLFKWKGNSNKYWYTADTSGQYFVTVTDSNNCEAKDTINVIVYDQPVKPFPQDSIIICPSVVPLDAQNPGANFLWNTGATSQVIQPVNSGLYSVTITSQDGCVETDQVQVDFFGSIATGLGPDQTFCLGGSATLNAGQSHPLQTYSWSTGATSQVLVASAPGQYWVTVTSPDGCTASDTMNLNALLPPVVNLGPDRFACNSFTLSAGNPGATYLWQNNSTAQSISGTTSGTYYVTVTNAAGCSATDSVVITVASKPIVNLGPNQVVCNGQSVTMNAGNPGHTYLWSTGATTQSISVNTPGIYIVEVTNPTSGCKGYDTLVVTGSSLVVNLGPGGQICANQPYTLDAGNPGNSYAWSTGATTQTVVVTQPGSYSVTVTDNIGCSATSSVTLTAGSAITSDWNAPASKPLFQPVSFTDQSTGSPTSWLWNFGDGSTSTQQNPSHVYVAMGSFNVCLTVSNGACSDTYCDDITILAPVGIEDEAFANGITVYPNPSTGRFNLGLDFARAFDLKVEIIDLTGRAIFAKELDGVTKWTESIDISENASGIYLMKVSEKEGRQQVLKIILE